LLVTLHVHDSRLRNIKNIQESVIIRNISILTHEGQSFLRRRWSFT